VYQGELKANKSMISNSVWPIIYLLEVHDIITKVGNGNGDLITFEKLSNLKYRIKIIIIYYISKVNALSSIVLSKMITVSGISEAIFRNTRLKAQNIKLRRFS